ncbi:hypothetical protein HY642_01880 [Candidatus Woesearchaeota archaeon]|nr:hypothetical protein [Candidatus Woesearchaeota archaeon]
MKHAWLAVLGIFIVSVAARLLLAFGVPHFSADEAYFHVRQVNHILETGRPLFSDQLSYSGTVFIFSPVYDYLLAGASIIMPVHIVLKVLPNLLASLSVIFAYLLAKRMSASHTIGLFTAFLMAFVPVFFDATFNSASSLSLAVPFMLFLIHAFLKIDVKSWRYAFIAGIVAFAFTSPLVIIFVFGLLCYAGLCRLGKVQQVKGENEVMLFSAVFVLWALLIQYKKLFLFHGPAVIYQNIPAQILAEYFSNITILGAAYQIGLIPLVFGIWLVYRTMLKEPRRDLHLLTAFAIVATMLLWLRLIELKTGLVFLGVLLVLLFAESCRLFFGYIEKTHAAKQKQFFAAGLVLVFVLSSVFPAVQGAARTLARAVTPDQVAALEWLRENSEKDAVIMATVDEGNLVTAIAERGNVIDTNFLLRPKADQRYADVRTLFTTTSETEAVGLMNQYGATYIFLSEKGRSQFGIKDLAFTSDCFKQVYDRGVYIYHVPCRVVRTQ